LSTSQITAFRLPKADSKGNLVIGCAHPERPIETYLRKYDKGLNQLCEITSSDPIIQPPTVEYFELMRTTNLIRNVTRGDRIIWGDYSEYVIHIHNPEGECIEKIVKEDDTPKIKKKKKKS
jgi:hypothetical protein